MLNRRTYDNNPDTSVAERDITYTYDNVGHVLQAIDSNGWHNGGSYDALGRMTQQTSNLSTTTFLYDAGGRRLRQTWADGFYVTYEYDATGAVTTIKQNGSSTLVAYAYDNLGRRTSLSRANGVTTSYGYDAASRLTSLGQDLSGTTYDLTLGFGYNLAGQITSRTSSNDAYAWTGAVNVNRSYTINGLNQYTASGSTSLSYDGRGNLNASGSQGYSYNTRNQLFTIGTGTLFYSAPSGLLGQIIAGGVTTNLDWVGGQLATESGTSGIERRYVYGPGADEPLVWYEGSGTSDRRFLVADERGSVIAATDGSGNALSINRYDEYGIPSPLNQGRFGYTGQAWIPALGMWYYKARMYSPTLGRFMQTDPIGYGDGLNWYNYVGGDPVNGSDPSGLATTAGCAGGQMHQVICDPRPWRPDNSSDDITVRGRSVCGTTTCIFGSANISAFQDDQARHQYYFGADITPPNTHCTLRQAMDVLNKFAIPGADGPKKTGQNYHVSAVLFDLGDIRPVIPLGHVLFEVRLGGQAIRNTTLSDHLMRYGSVEMRITGSQRDGFSIAGIGYGTNGNSALAFLNKKLGPGAFDDQMRKMAEELEKCN